jgi:2-iminobutanoate/2-iminopropanoate deaminase
VAPFSQGVRAGAFVFTAGQGALDEKGQLVGPDDIALQTEQTLSNVRRVLASLGADWSDVVKVTIWLRSFDDYAEFNAVYRRMIPEPWPPRACVRADLVPLWDEELLVEIEAMAIVGR